MHVHVNINSASNLTHTVLLSTNRYRRNEAFPTQNCNELRFIHESMIGVFILNETAWVFIPSTWR